jgi:hypothetical protein
MFYIMIKVINNILMINKIKNKLLGKLLKLYLLKIINNKLLSMILFLKLY